MKFRPKNTKSNSTFSKNKSCSHFNGEHLEGPTTPVRRLADHPFGQKIEIQQKVKKNIPLLRQKFWSDQWSAALGVSFGGLRGCPTIPQTPSATTPTFGVNRKQKFKRGVNDKNFLWAQNNFVGYGISTESF